MSIKRGHITRVDHFTIVPNEWLRDARLSRRARGLLAELMSHAPGWETSVESLVASGPEGRDAIRGALAELESCGYLQRSQGRDESGRLAGADYLVTDPADLPSSDNPTSVEPTSAEPPHKKNNSQKTISKKINTPAVAVDESFETFWSAYPRKVAKPVARRAWAKAIKDTPAETIMACLKRFPFSDVESYIPHPSTWLNQRRWEDEATRPAAPPPIGYVPGMPDTPAWMTGR